MNSLKKISKRPFEHYRRIPQCTAIWFLQGCGCDFSAVYVNNESNMVWAVDSKANIYARRGITSRLPIGTSWLLLQGRFIYSPSCKLCNSISVPPAQMGVTAIPSQTLQLPCFSFLCSMRDYLLPICLLLHNTVSM